MSFIDRARSLLTLGLAGPADTSARSRTFDGINVGDVMKSLGDYSVAGGTLMTTPGIGRIIEGAGGKDTRFYLKQRTDTLRQYAEGSVHVRTALDILRDVVARAEPKLVAIDSTKPVDQAVKFQCENIFQKPNPGETSYKSVKEQFLEDYLVIGHGAMEKAIQKNGAPYALFPLDAARIGISRDWDGTDLSQPRYALYDQGNELYRYFADAQAFVMVNRTRTYDRLGVSHVEALDLAIRAILFGDQYLFGGVSTPSPAGALVLQGADQPQVEQVRAMIGATPKAFIVVGTGGENAQFLDFKLTARAIATLDQQSWFVRQVCAIFGISTAMMKLAVDTSRANTQAMMEMDTEGTFRSLILRVAEEENSQILRSFGDPQKHNLKISYPILNQKDNKIQSDISKNRLPQCSVTSVNEERTAIGLEPDENPLADERWVRTPLGPIPLSAYSKQYPINDPEPGPEDDTEGEYSYHPRKRTTAWIGPRKALPPATQIEFGADTRAAFAKIDKTDIRAAIDFWKKSAPDEWKDLIIAKRVTPE